MARGPRRTEGAFQGSYLVESLFLLAILATAVAVFMSLFSLAASLGERSVGLDRATRVATNAAERFCADPASVPASYEEDGCSVTVEVTPQNLGAGTLWRAAISVAGADGQVVYVLETARYEGEVS